MAAKTPTEGMGRRDFVKKAAYIAPAILTLAAAPEFAKAGSTKGVPVGPHQPPPHWPPPRHHR